MKSQTSMQDFPLNSSPPEPPYLSNTEPMELDDVPLQLALLTMEVRAQRQALQRLSAALGMAGRMTALPGLDDGAGRTNPRT